MCFIIVATSAAPAVLNGAYCPNAVVVTLVTAVTFITAAAVQLSFHMQLHSFLDAYVRI